MKRARPGSRLLTAVSVVVLTWVSGGPALAQDSVADDSSSARALQEGVQVRLRGRGADPDAYDAVDESALRYFASRGDRAKVEAEIARLRALHPGWQPPVDLFGERVVVDEQPLWDLYQQQDYDGVRQAIAGLVREHPDWHPPQNLLDLIEGHEVRAELQSLEQAGQWRGLLDVATAHPRQVDCDRIDNMWRVARAHAELDQQDEAATVYARVIEQCDQVDQRIATLQKAKGQVSQDQLDQLFALEQTRAKPPGAERRIAELQDSANESDDSPLIKALFEGTPRPGMLEDAEVEVMSRRHGAGAERLGWIYYNAKDWDEAARWFRRALRWQPGPAPAEGLARSYAKLGRVNEAAALAETYPRELGPIVEELRREWIADAFARGDHDLLLRQTENVTMPWARNLRGWSLVQLDRPTEASRTFADVLRDDEAPLSARREAAYGLAWATLATGSLRDAEAVIAAHDLNPEDQYEIQAEVLRRRAQRAYDVQDYGTYLSLMERRRGFAEPTRDQLVQEAWARYHWGQKHTAKLMFERLHHVYATKETREGLEVVGNDIDHHGL